MHGNSSKIDDEDSPLFKVLLNSTLIFLGVIIITSNLLIILIYMRGMKIREKSPNLLLFNQALVDLFQGSVTNGFELFGTRDVLVPKLAIYQFSISLSLHTVVFVAIERYLLIQRPLFHKRVVTMFRMRVAVALCWLSSLLWIPFRLWHLVGANRHEDIDMKTYIIYYIIISDAIFFVLLVIMTYIHVSVYRAVRRFIGAKYQKVSRSSQHLPITFQQKIKLQYHMKEVRVTKIFFSMFIAFIISYVPLVVTGLIHASGASESFNAEESNYMSLDVVFFLCNCAFNPVVTFVYKEDYRRVLMRWKETTVRTILTCHQQETTEEALLTRKRALRHKSITKMIWRRKPTIANTTTFTNDSCVEMKHKENKQFSDIETQSATGQV